ncbi:MAG TPA: thiamine phosphate synthase [Candidatus Dormibacteraeota bacterium]|nr:thiamine phosphate synthase [Candidatus Dormibacteraeota bacterium]
MKCKADRVYKGISLALPRVFRGISDLAIETTQQRLRAARLYAITPDQSADRTLRLVEAWLRGGADVVQLRNKVLARSALLPLAIRVAELCRERGAVFIVNDHVDVALAAGADGVHLGPDDLSVEAARRLASPPFVVGASAGSPEAARAAELSGADYLGSGPAYATPIKAEKRVIGPEGVARVQASVSIPVFAIGGIDGERIPELRAAGVQRVCVIRALALAPDPEQEVRRLRGAIAG